MNEVSSLIGLQQMPDINRLIHLQRSNAQAWQSRLVQHAGVKPLIPIDNTLPNFWVYGVLCDNKNEAIDAFRESGWYATGVHINNNLYSVFGKQPELKGVNLFMEKFLALPCGWWINE
jgi:dTDP-4-amino-4,6-dideoxygalactose transaminase